VSKNDIVALVSTSGGVVAVVGPISDEDGPVLERLLRELRQVRIISDDEAASAAA
jgi:hypothetical protein